AHADVDFDGQIDVVLYDAKFTPKTAKTSGDEISVIAKSRGIPSANPVFISSLTARVSGPGGALVSGTDGNLISPNPITLGPKIGGPAGTFTATRNGQQFAPGAYTVEFSVTLTNTGAAGNTATGITYN